MEPPRLVHLAVPAVVVAAAIVVLLAVPKPAAREASAARGARSFATAVASLAGARADSPEPDAAAAALLERRLVRTGSLSVEVDRYAEAAEKAVAIAEAHGGYLADARVERDAGDRQRGTLTLKVEARAFDEAFRKWKRLGRVEAASIETQEVGRAYADLETRLSVKRDAQARLTQILKTKTGSLSDLVEAERELSRLVEESERLEGERRYLDRQIAYSATTLTLHEPAAFLRDGAGAPLLEAAREALPLLARSCAAMLYAAAAALPWALLAAFLWRLKRRARVRRLIRLADAGN